MSALRHGLVWIVTAQFFNVLNNSDVLAYNNAYSLTTTPLGANWGQPTNIQPPRYARFSVQLDF
jgi:hypothetical protein